MTAVFIGTWVVLGIVCFVLFFLGRNTELKRTWWPRFVIAVGVLFALFSTALSVLSSPSWESLGILIVVVPAVAVISYLNIKFTKFCGSCGATVFDQNWFSPTRFCSKCGAAFGEKAKTTDHGLD